MSGFDVAAGVLGPEAVESGARAVEGVPDDGQDGPTVGNDFLCVAFPFPATVSGVPAVDHAKRDGGLRVGLC